ncbi:4Fe-4S dicluster domain-containing protein [Desulfobaculum sp. SPO524]|uniref:4Fe-4S dicluster domain-containing protein n=1 Tax=Desulfobaculum sp. SPO524 TaxID=3378071 RepID=UPI003852BE3C
MALWRALLSRQTSATPPEVTPGACLPAPSRHCGRCVAVCPAGAITLADAPHVDASACLGCGLCASVCPADALHCGGVADLLRAASLREDRSTLALACSGAPAGPETDTDAPVIRIPGCLSALGVETLAALAASGVTALVLPANACAACECGDHGKRLRDAALLLDQLAPGALTITQAPAARGKAARAPRDASDPALSRRALLRQFAPRKTAATTPRPLLLPAAGEGEDKQPPARRRLLHAALERLCATSAPQETAPGEAPSHIAPVSAITVSRTCTACGACARACPTGALCMTTQSGAFRLEHEPWQCIGCGLCRRTCLPKSLTVTPGPPALLAAPARLLASGELATCKRCGAVFAGADGPLCPLCARRANGDRL